MFDDIEGSIGDAWDDLFGGGDGDIPDAADSIASGASTVTDPITNAFSGALPSGTEIWVGVAALIVILFLVAYISREVAG
jgi:hypothetical protein